MKIQLRGHVCGVQHSRRKVGCNHSLQDTSSIITGSFMAQSCQGWKADTADLERWIVQWELYIIWRSSGFDYSEILYPALTVTVTLSVLLLPSSQPCHKPPHPSLCLIPPPSHPLHWFTASETSLLAFAHSCSGLWHGRIEWQVISWDPYKAHWAVGTCIPAVHQDWALIEVKTDLHQKPVLRILQRKLYIPEYPQGLTIQTFYILHQH